MHSKPSGQGEHLIILHTGSKDGWAHDNFFGASRYLCFGLLKLIKHPQQITRNDCTKLVISIKTHGSVSQGPKNGACANGVSILKRTTKL